jgi:hypothetical protein
MADYLEMNMGAWGHDTFDNDTACDWAYGLEECDDLSVICETLNRVIECGDEYLDSEDASQALAACDTIARLRGNFGVRNPYTEPVDKWVAAHADLKTDRLLPIAHRVIDRIVAEDSELLELWRDSDSFREWQASVEDLRSRLK